MNGRSALGHRGRMLAIALASFLLVSTPAGAGVSVFDELLVVKGVERQDGALAPPTPYFFEVCISGPDISGSTLPTVQTPPSTNFPGGSLQTLTQVVDEFCFEQFYTSAAARDADFANGSYTVTATNGAETATDSKQVSFTAADPTAYAAVTAPTNGSGVSTVSPTAVSWSLVDKGGCNLAQPATCLDFFVVGTFENDPGLDAELDFQLLNDPTATGTSVPAVFQAGSAYQIEVETLRGTTTNETTDTLGQSVSVLLVSTDINTIDVVGELPAQPILEILFFKGLDRDDGVAIPNPYFVELCVTGSDIPTSPPNALPMVQTPPSVDFPAGTTQPMTPFGSEFCFEAVDFANAAALEASYPAGNYTVTVTDNSQTTDSVTVNFDATEPTGFPDIFDPVAGAMVPFDQNLQIQWGSLVAKSGGCNPGVPSTCADGILLFAVDEGTGNDVDTQELPVSAGATSVDASVLQPSTLYGLELETFRGSFAQAATSDTLGNPIQVTQLYEDINIVQVTTVPEPGTLALRLGALAAILFVARRRRGSRG